MHFLICLLKGEKLKHESGPPLAPDEDAYYRRLFSKQSTTHENSGDSETTRRDGLHDGGGWIAIALVPRLLKASAMLSGNEGHTFLRQLAGRLDADSNKAVTENEYIRFLR